MGNLVQSWLPALDGVIQKLERRASVADDDLRALFRRAGFSRFRRAAETPFNRVFEARP